MTEVGHDIASSSSATSLDYGDNFEFKVAITFPEVVVADKFNLNLEIFTLEPTQGRRILAFFTADKILTKTKF